MSNTQTDTLIQVRCEFENKPTQTFRFNSVEEAHEFKIRAMQCNDLVPLGILSINTSICHYEWTSI